MENFMILDITSNHCPICISSPYEFGELPDTPYDTGPSPGMPLLITIPTWNKWNLTLSKMRTTHSGIYPIVNPMK